MIRFWDDHRQALDRGMTGIALWCLLAFAATILFARKIEPPAVWSRMLVAGLLLEGAALYLCFAYKSLTIFVNPFGDTVDEDFSRFRYPAFRRLAMRMFRVRCRTVLIASSLGSLVCCLSGSLLLLLFGLRNLL